jgi:hypothetical protein
MMPRILRFALMVLMAIASAVFIYGMVKNLIVYRRSRPQPIGATHNRMQLLQLYPTIENSFIRNVQRRMEFGIVRFHPNKLLR